MAPKKHSVVVVQNIFRRMRKKHESKFVKQYTISQDQAQNEGGTEDEAVNPVEAIKPKIASSLKLYNRKSTNMYVKVKLGICEYTLLFFQASWNQLSDWCAQLCCSKDNKIKGQAQDVEDDASEKTRCCCIKRISSKLVEMYESTTYSADNQFDI